MNSKELWQAVLGELQFEVSAAVFQTWFKKAGVHSHTDSVVTISVPNVYTRDRLDTRFNKELVAVLKKLLPNFDHIEYIIPTGTKDSAPVAPRDAMINNQPHQPALSPPVAQSAFDTIAASPSPAGPLPAGGPLNSRYTMESFIVGSNNDLAFAACQAVAHSPGNKYNPLFLYGGVGLGKTHLMQAVGNEIQRRDPHRKVAYVTSEQFTREFIGAITQGKKGKQFADKYRNLDVLIIDDVQFFAGKESTQEEFFHTFNALQQANKQIIISSDQPPRTLSRLEDRLRSRFESGMVVDIQKPDLETRSAIIQAKALARGVELEDEVTQYLARHFQDNVRELEGGLTKVLAQCEFRGKQPSLSFVSSIIDHSSPAVRRRPPSPKMVIEKTAAFYNIMPTDILGTKRDKDIVVPRQVAMYLMRHELGLSYPKIAQHTGGRDHTTAIHSVSKIEKLLELDDELRGDLNQVRERITSP